MRNRETLYWKNISNKKYDVLGVWILNEYVDFDGMRVKVVDYSVEGKQTVTVEYDFPYFLYYFGKPNWYNILTSTPMFFIYGIIIGFTIFTILN